MNRNESKHWTQRLVLAIASISLLISACNKNNQVPVIPPPGASNPNYGYGGYGGGYGGAGCAVGLQYPLEPGGAPYVAQLTDYSGNGRGNSITMSLSYLTLPSASVDMQNIVGSGQLQLPSFATVIPGMQFSTIPVCSSDPTNGTVSPGKYVSIDKSIALTLRGIIPNTYYSAGLGYAKPPQVYAEIGYSGGAFVYPGNNFQGFVDITIEYWDPIYLIPNIQTYPMYAQ